jgi:2-polyprenyl-3-methyl-5-hydroxy-6-metoxy-1,4-benzoquinol methylase
MAVPVDFVAEEGLKTKGCKMNAGSVKYTHGHHESVLRSHQRRTAEDSAAYLLPHLKSGMSVLDIGCGPGTITADLAILVAPGPVLAVDQVADVLETARAEAHRRNLSNISFGTADVHRLDFPDDAFDVVHAHQVLQHVADPVQALREMRRVCRPGGIVAVRDADYAGFIWFPQLPALDIWRDAYRQAAVANGGEPDAGRRLLSWALAAGFDDVTPTGSVWCYATPADREWWGGMWADRILHSTIAADMVRLGLATAAQLDQISAAWREWAAAADGWITIPHGEIICRA